MKTRSGLTINHNVGNKQEVDTLDYLESRYRPQTYLSAWLGDRIYYNSRRAVEDDCKKGPRFTDQVRAIFVRLIDVVLSGTETSTRSERRRLWILIRRLQRGKFEGITPHNAAEFKKKMKELWRTTLHDEASQPIVFQRARTKSGDK